MKKEILTKIQCLTSSNNPKEAVKLAENSYKKYKDNCFLNEILKIHEKAKNRKSAIKILLKMLKSEKNNINLIKKLATNYFYTQQYKQALKYYKIVLECEPASSQNNFNIACTYDFLKDYKNAELYYSRAVSLDSKNISALNNLGLVFYNTKQYGKAIKIFKSAIGKAPNHPEAYHHMGLVNREYLKDYELSVLYYQKARRLDPKHIENTYQLALSYLKYDKPEKAKIEFENCIKMNPNHKRALEQLSRLK